MKTLYTKSSPIGIGDSGMGASVPQNSGKKFLGGKYDVKFGHYTGKNHAKIGNLLICRAHIIQIRVFCYFC